MAPVAGSISTLVPTPVPCIAPLAAPSAAALASAAAASFGSEGAEPDYSQSEETHRYALQSAWINGIEAVKPCSSSSLTFCELITAWAAPCAAP